MSAQSKSLLLTAYFQDLTVKKFIAYCFLTLANIKKFIASLTVKKFIAYGLSLIVF